eukprot:TRINITY_DN613_c0_g1_i1.p1 TRINITY_DN613_c0_g1~~TRINITY_DN613_c0_g1_i1.p1  ORF type:complete len:1374 (-),score=350.32 TRINITY_DN613_c0_g1_i1:2973-6620(-)
MKVHEIATPLFLSCKTSTSFMRRTAEFLLIEEELRWLGAESCVTVHEKDGEWLFGSLNEADSSCPAFPWDEVEKKKLLGALSCHRDDTRELDDYVVSVFFCEDIQCAGFLHRSLISSFGCIFRIGNTNPRKHRVFWSEIQMTAWRNLSKCLTKCIHGIHGRGSVDWFESMTMEYTLPSFIVDVETKRIIQINDAATITFGFSREEFTNMQFIDCHPTHEKEHVHQYFFSLTEASSKIQSSFMCKDGEEIPVEINAFRRTRDGRDLVFGAMSDMRPILERVKQVEKTRDYYRELFHLVPESILLIQDCCDSELATNGSVIQNRWKILSANHSAEKLFECSSETLQGSYLESFFDNGKRSSSAFDVTNDDDERTCEKESSPFPKKIVLKLAEGSIRYVQIHATCVDNELPSLHGEFASSAAKCRKFYFVVLHDNSAVQAVRHSFESLVHTFSEAVGMIRLLDDGKMFVTDANPAFSEILGVEVGEKVTADSFEACLGISEAIFDVARQKRPKLVETYVSSISKWFLLSLHPASFEKKEVFMILFDISETKRDIEGLRRRKNVLFSVINAVDDGILATGFDAEQPPLFWNEGFSRILGRNEEEIGAMTVNDMCEEMQLALEEESNHLRSFILSHMNLVEYRTRISKKRASEHCTQKSSPPSGVNDGSSSISSRSGGVFDDESADEDGHGGKRQKRAHSGCSQTSDLGDVMVLKLSNQKMYEISSFPLVLKSKQTGWVFSVRDISIDFQLKEMTSRQKRAKKELTARTMFLSAINHDMRTPLNGIISVLDILESKLEIPEDTRKWYQIMRFSSNSLLSLIQDVLDFTRLEERKLHLMPRKINFTQKMNLLCKFCQVQLEGKPDVAFIPEMDGAIPNEVFVDWDRLNQLLLNLLSNAIKFTEVGHITLRTVLVKIDVKTVVVKFEVEDTGIGMDPARKDHIFQEFVQLSSSSKHAKKGSGLGLSIFIRLLNLMGGGSVEIDTDIGQGAKISFLLPIQRKQKRGKRYPVTDVMSDQSPARRRSVLCSTSSDPSIGRRASKSMPKLKDIKALVVDDDSTNRLVLSKLLEVSGMSHIEQAEDGKSAVDLITLTTPTTKETTTETEAKRNITSSSLPLSASTPPSLFRKPGSKFPDNVSLVLMDCHMPLMSGYEASMKIKEFDANIIIIGVTGDSTVHGFEKCITSGMDDVLTKPISLESLSRALMPHFQLEIPTSKHHHHSSS